MKNELNKGNSVALLPFLIFVCIYLFSGIILQAKGVEMAFYQFPAPIAAFIGIIFAFILTKGDLNSKFDTFIRGCGDENIITMCIIYLLAGAFCAISSKMGGVESTVNLGLTLIPPNFITVGIFVVAAFIALATGTSVGTVVAVAPIAMALSEGAGLNLPLSLGALVGGALFGDNLSIISDTTIAATKTQGVEMKDKFRANLGFAVPAAIVTIILLFIFGRPETTPEVTKHAFNLIKVIPYLFVLVAALSGLNVLVVLTGGIVLSSGIGLFYGSFDFLALVKETYTGFTNMTDIFLLSLLTGGLANMVSSAGGIDWILHKVKKMIKGEKSAQLGIGALVALTDAAIANNTVSIIVNSELAKEVSKEYKVDPRKTASILDTFSCIMQGLIPYGAQLLIAASVTKGALSPVELVPNVWYCVILAIFAIISMFTPLGNGYLRKNPWDFEKHAVAKHSN